MLQDIYRDILDDESIILTEETTADDIEDWDSLMHITLISEVEDAFDVHFSMKDVTGMHNVGEMVSIILEQA